MGIVDGIEKLINEHGSAVILNQQLALAKEQFAALERQVADLQMKAAKLEVQLEIEFTNHRKTSEDLQKLKEEHAEEIRVHSGIEFRRGKRTGGAWLPFCPTCHVPADISTPYVRCGHPKCGWATFVGSHTQLPRIVAGL